MTPAEKQQVEAAVDAFLASPNVQATLTTLISKVESKGLSVADTVISNTKVGGLFGSVVNAFKGSAESELNALVNSLPDSAKAQILTNWVGGELKTLLGA